MASNSKLSATNETKFTEAEKDWNLNKLYKDLTAAKLRCGSVKRKTLTETEKCYLRGLLCGYSPEKIAKERGVRPKGVSTTLSTTLYCYIKELLGYTKEIRHWGDVPDFLDKAGYKIQASDPSEPSHPLPDNTENTLETSHKIEAISFLEYFSKAIDQLHSPDIDVRIGAISMLEMLAECSQPAQNWKIMESLATFIRAKAPRKKEEEGEDIGFLKRIPKDIQAALTVIVQRDLNKNEGVLDLSNTELRGAKLSKSNLHRVNLDGANLKGVRLDGAILHRASLRGANLQKARLWGAELQWAKLRFADLHGARLSKANLEGADLRNTKLHEANFLKVDLNKACLRGVDLTTVKNLESRQIVSADGDSATRLPDNLSLPVRWMQAKPRTGRDLLIRAALEYKWSK